MQWLPSLTLQFISIASNSLPQPDARERFMEAKTAYQQLLEAAEAREQQASAGPSRWGGGTSAASSRPSNGGYERAAPRPRQQEEEFYGLGEPIGAAGSTMQMAAALMRACAMSRRCCFCSPSVQDELLAAAAAAVGSAVASVWQPSCGRPLSLRLPHVLV